MWKHSKTAAALLGAAASLGTAVTREGHALAQSCSDTSGAINPPLTVAGGATTSPVVILSGDTQEPMLRALTQKLRNSVAQQTSVLYATTGTCTIVADMYNTDPTKRMLAAGTVMSYPPSTLENPTWDPSQVPSTCTLDAATTIDLGIAATYTASCTANPPPTDVGLFPGPIAGYGFIVPKASSQISLTAEQGFFVFGFGDNSQALPWIDDHFMFTRLATKSTELTLAANVGVTPVTKMKGTPFNGSTEVLSSVAQSTNPEKTIGLMGTEIYDVNRDKVTELAFRAFGQRYAYLPDSSPTSFDKKNLRDGHYTPWAQTIYISTIDATTKAPLVPNAQLFIDLVLGNRKLADVDGLATIISKGLVPFCAMQVTRDSIDAAPLRGYASPTPCSCLFEAKVPNGKTSCTTCTMDTDCGDGGVQKCRNNYCEAR